MKLFILKQIRDSYAKGLITFEEYHLAMLPFYNK